MSTVVELRKNVVGEGDDTEAPKGSPLQSIGTDNRSGGKSPPSPQ